MDEYILQAQNICKRFPGQLVLKDINLSFKKGSVHALVGENGAGKSTFVNIISGSIPPTSGCYVFEGKTITESNPQETQSMGIGVVHQELNLIPEMTVAENIFLGREIKNSIGKIDWRETRKQARELLSNFDVAFNERAKVSSLSVAEQQMVEIVKVTSMDARLIFMDEPTAVLTEKETTQLFKTITRLREQGKTIIYISHRLGELNKICDTISVLRDGTHVFTGPIAGLTTDQIVEMMVAHTVDEQYPYEPVKPSSTSLKVSDINQGKKLKGVSFDVKKGEILGVYGLVGAGRTELARAIIGADKIDSGTIEFNGKSIKIKNPTDAINNKIAYITESRREFGLMLDMDIKFNSSIASLKNYTDAFGKINRKTESKYVDESVKSLAIKTESTKKSAGKLSGGNQQKVLLARYLLTNPEVLIFDEPTRGIDVGAKVSIYQILNKLKSEGISIIMISSDLPEVMGVSDRIMVMYDGAVTGMFERGEISEEAIGRCAFGEEKGNMQWKTV